MEKRQELLFSFLLFFVSLLFPTRSWSQCGASIVRTTGIMIIDEGDTESGSPGSGSADNVIFTYDECSTTLNVTFRLAHLDIDDVTGNYVYPLDENGNPTETIVLRIGINDIITDRIVLAEEFLPCGEIPDVYYWTAEFEQDLEEVCNDDGMNSYHITFLDMNGDNYDFGEYASEGEIFDCSIFHHTSECCKSSCSPLYVGLSHSEPIPNLNCDACDPGFPGPPGGGRSTELETENQNFDLSFQPNPFNGQALLKVKGLANETFEVQITDVQGKLIHQQVGVIPDSGHHQIILSTSNWSTGLYFSRLIQKGSTKTIRIIKSN